jgi:hypothetical protein
MKSVKICLTILVVMLAFSPISEVGAGSPVSAVCPISGEWDEEISVVRIYYETIEDIKRLSAFDVFEYNNVEEGYFLAAVNAVELESLQALGFKVLVDQQETENFRLMSEVLGDNQIQSISGYECYRTVEETYASAAAIAASHPNLAAWIDVGDSWEKVTPGGLTGYDLMVLKLTNLEITADKPILFITAALHAREYATAELVMRFGEYLVDNYGIDADATWILDHHEIHLMLHANPDGRKKAEEGLSWRKNTNNNYCANTNSRGADLNRNFDFNWACCGGSSPNQCDATYRGPSAASEPETQAIQNYMASIFTDQRGPSLSDPAPLDTTGIYIDVHSYSELILWPWGFTNSTPPNAAGLQTLGRKWAYFNDYKPQQSYALYPTDGSTVDYAYGVFGVPGYTWEIGTAFFQTCTYFNNTIVPENMPALIYSAKVPRTPYMTPAGPDALSLSLSAGIVPLGMPVTLNATIDDTRYNNSNGTEPTQNIAAAEYYIDIPPWEDGSTAYPMAAADGSFNSKIEGVTASIDTSSLTGGRHILFVRGQDINGNWGAMSAIFLEVDDSDNEPPVADDLTIFTDEDTPVAVVLTGSDPDGDPLTFSIVDPPVYGTLSGTSPNLIYTPNPDYYGTDVFTYVASDGILNSTPATVNITINPVNDAPVALDQAVFAQAGGCTFIELTGHDVDGDPLTFSLATLPAHGTLVGSPPTLVYNPVPGFIGMDSFTFTANDGLVDSTAGTITINVNLSMPIPVFWDDFETDLGWVRDPDGTDTATLGLWERAIPETVTSGGTVTQLGTTVSGVYDLVTGPLAGSSAGSYDIDGGVTSIRSPNINLPANREITLSFYYYLAHLSNATSVDYFRVKVVGDTTQTVFEKLATGANVSAAWQQVSVDLSGFAGQSIYLLIEAADAGSASLVEAAVDDVSITASNQAPSANPQTLNTAEGQTIEILLTGSDPDGDPFTFVIISPVSSGLLSGDPPNLAYTPEPGFTGLDSFTFIAQDWSLSSCPAQVTLDVFNPTSVDLISFFSATSDKGSIRLTWETQNEVNNIGFNIYRATKLEGEKIKINTDLIPAAGSFGPIGATYEFVDTTIRGARAYYYWLEDVDINYVRTLHGPIEARAKFVQLSQTRSMNDVFD